MAAYILKGTLKDYEGKPITRVKIQAMDSDQMWFEDRNDDILDSKWTNEDGTFEISFDNQQFQEAGWLERKPDIYLIVRNSIGQIIHTTEIRRGVDASDIQNLTLNITLNSLENFQHNLFP